MRLMGALFALVLIGCSAGPKSPEERLAGSWSVDLTNDCGEAMTFTDDGRYEADIACLLAGTTAVGGIEAEIGNYEVNGSTLKFTPTKASCPTSNQAPGSISIGFQFKGQTLVLADPTGVLVLTRVPKSDASAAGGYGCWDQGTFTPHPIQTL